MWRESSWLAVRLPWTAAAVAAAAAAAAATATAAAAAAATEAAADRAAWKGRGGRWSGAGLPRSRKTKFALHMLCGFSWGPRSSQQRTFTHLYAPLTHLYASLRIFD